MIDIIDIWKSFGEHQVLSGLNLNIRDGETMAIIGGSGTGKTVLLKHMIGLLKPDRGDILIKGKSLSKSTSNELFEIRERFGMVFQSGALLNSLTVSENIALPLVEHTDMQTEEITEIVNEKLQMVRLAGIEKEKPANLSGGMKKRVAVARAIVRNPEIILYDEPTSGLDPITAHSIENLIVDLRDSLGVTSVVVTHNIEGAYRIADRIAMLLEGKVVETGTPEDIRKSKNPVVSQLIHGEISGPLSYVKRRSAVSIRGRP